MYLLSDQLKKSVEDQNQNLGDTGIINLLQTWVSIYPSLAAKL
jgi:hypothetical protein